MPSMSSSTTALISPGIFPCTMLRASIQHEARDRLGAAARAEFVARAADVKFHGVGRDRKNPADLPVGLAGRDPVEALALALGQHVVAVLRLLGGFELPAAFVREQRGEAETEPLLRAEVEIPFGAVHAD